MTYGTVQANAIQGSINTFSPNSAVFRNRIINGGMVVDQRNAGASTSIATGDRTSFGVDRFCYQKSSSSYGVTSQRSTVAPIGFTNSLLTTVTSAFSPASGDYLTVGQIIEGFNCDLGFGTANAKTVTISFWVRSSVTGTYSATLSNGSGNRAYASTYVVNAANTFEYKTITIPGDTSGTWATDNTAGLWIRWDLGSGSSFNGTVDSWQSSYIKSSSQVTWANNASATFYITGVQLEVGSTATSFDYRPYGTELQLCQRYFYQTNRYLGLTQSSDTLYGPAIAFPVTMRTTPTLNTGATFTARTGSNGAPLISSGVTGIVATNDAVAVYNSSSNWSTNTWVSFNGGFTAEL